MKFIAINPWTERSDCWRYMISMSARWPDRKPFWSAWKCDEIGEPKLLLVSDDHLHCEIACALKVQESVRPERVSPDEDIISPLLAEAERMRKQAKERAA